jgi:hypothetical protein
VVSMRMDDYDNRSDEVNAAHTISQRLRQLKKIPPELLPLAVVLAYVPETHAILNDD